jgi:hypothetical protein
MVQTSIGNPVYTELNLYDFEQARFEEYLEVQPSQPEYNIEY